MEIPCIANEAHVYIIWRCKSVLYSFFQDWPTLLKHQGMQVWLSPWQFFPMFLSKCNIVYTLSLVIFCLYWLQFLKVNLDSWIPAENDNTCYKHWKGWNLTITIKRITHIKMTWLSNDNLFLLIYLNVS